MKKENLGYLQIIIASALFGFVPIIVRFGGDIGAYNLSFFRVLVAVLFLAGWFLIFGKKLVPLKYELKRMFLFGALHGFIILGYFIAIQYLNVASAVLLLYSSSIWMILFSRLILKEKLTKLTALALIIAVIGVILLLSPKNIALGKSLVGVISGLLGGVGFGLVYVLSKTFKKYDKVSLTFWQNVIALPFLLPLIFIDIPRFNLGDTGLIILLGTLFTIIPFILVYNGFQKVQAQKGAVLVLLDMIFPILFALIVFKEIPSILTVIGGILIIIGSYIATK